MQNQTKAQTSSFYEVGQITALQPLGQLNPKRESENCGNPDTPEHLGGSQQILADN